MWHLRSASRSFCYGRSTRTARRKCSRRSVVSRNYEKRASRSWEATLWCRGNATWSLDLLACYIKDDCRSHERDKNSWSPRARGPGIQKEQDGFLLVEREGGREREEGERGGDGGAGGGEERASAQKGSCGRGRPCLQPEKQQLAH